MDTTQQQRNISISIGLLQSLRPRHRNRFSRSEAFIDLMCRVLGTTDSGNANESSNMTSTVKKSDRTQTLRQFDTNYSQLASFWKWNRETVHTFLKTLETEGLLLYEQTGKRLSIYIDV